VSSSEAVARYPRLLDFGSRALSFTPTYFVSGVPLKRLPVLLDDEVL
jgi:hypothetical protein